MHMHLHLHIHEHTTYTQAVVFSRVRVCPCQHVGPCVRICAHVNAVINPSGDCACIAGYTGPNGGTCTACEEGKFKDSAGPAACSTCPGNSTSPAGLCGLFV